MDTTNMTNNELVKRIQSSQVGSEEYQILVRQLVDQNKGFLYHMVKKIGIKQYLFEDALSEAKLALLNSINVASQFPIIESKNDADLILQLTILNTPLQEIEAKTNLNSEQIFSKMKEAYKKYVRINIAKLLKEFSKKDTLWVSFA